MKEDNFKEFEHRGWQSVAGGYHDYFAGLTGQSIAPLLDALAPRPGQTVLDVATGPGYVAAQLVDRGLATTALDFSPVMLEKARALNPSLDLVEGDACNLPFADESFHLVCMNFGILHLDEPDRAIKEAFRVLKRGGRFAFSVWSKPDQAIAFGLVLEAISEFGDESVPLPSGPPFFRFSDRQECERSLREAGFSEIGFETVPMIWVLECAEHLFEAFYTGTPRTGGLLRAQTDEQLRDIKNAVLKAAESYGRGSENREAIEIPMSCHVVSGSK